MHMYGMTAGCSMHPRMLTLRATTPLAQAAAAIAAAGAAGVGTVSYPDSRIHVQACHWPGENDPSHKITVRHPTPCPACAFRVALRGRGRGQCMAP